MEWRRKHPLYGNISSVTGELGTVPHTVRELMCVCLEPEAPMKSLPAGSNGSHGDVFDLMNIEYLCG